MSMKNKHLYPKDWDKISDRIRSKSNWKCEICGKPCRPKNVSFKDTEIWLSDNHPDWLSELYDVEYDDELGEVFIPKPSRFTLSVVHLNHNPADCREFNLKAVCAVCTSCHLKYNSVHRANSRAKNRTEKLEVNGQLRLF